MLQLNQTKINDTLIQKEKITSDYLASFGGDCCFVYGGFFDHSFCYLNEARASCPNISLGILTLPKTFNFF